MLTGDLPRAKNGKVWWTIVPGFAEWFRQTVPGLTNEEAVAAIKDRYGVPLTSNAMSNMRSRFGAEGMTKEAKERSYRLRGDRNSVREPEVKAPPLPPGEKFELDDLTRKVRALEQRDTFFEVIGDKMLRAIANLPPLSAPSKITRPKPHGQSVEDVILMISDVQAGLIVDAKESGGLGSFNPTILVEQIRYLQETVLSICARYHPNARRLHIFWGGDIVEGEDIYGGQLREIEFGVIQQVLFCWHAFAELQLAFAGAFDEVVEYGVVGNHGRVGRKGEHSPMSNFDYLLYHMWRERLAGVKNIRWKVSESWWDVANVLGWKWLLVHGDDAGQGFAGIPFYCVPIEQEILTRRGWKHPDDLVLGEDVLALDVKTQRSRWEPLLAVNRFGYDGELLGLSEYRSTVWCTPQHRWPVRNRHTGEWGLREAQEVGSRYYSVPRCAPHDADTDILTPQEAAVLGWVVTDGYHRWRGACCEMIVYQHPRKHLKEVLRLTGGTARAPHPQTGVVAVNVPAGLSRRLTEHFHSKDDLPGLVTRLSAPAAEAMFDAMLKAEGSEARGEVQFRQNRGPVLEAFQILCILTGRTGSVRGGKCATLYVTRRPYRQLGRFQRRHHAGEVWCPTTPSGTWMMRSGGVPLWTGNSFIRHKTKYRELLRQLRNEFADFDYMAAGHISEISCFRQIYINGSWPGGTEFSLKRLQLGDVPAQWLIGVNEKHGATWARPLHLRPLRSGAHE